MGTGILLHERRLNSAAPGPWTVGITAAALFLIGLYVCLVGSKILIAWLVARSRGFLKSRGYVYVNRLLGVALVVFALLFVRDGLRFFGLVIG